MTKTTEDLFSKLCCLRREDWTKELYMDFYYDNIIEEMPTYVAKSQYIIVPDDKEILMDSHDEYVYQTYDLELVKDCIEDEKKGRSYR